METRSRWRCVLKDTTSSVAGMHASGRKARTDMLEENNVNKYRVCDG